MAQSRYYSSTAQPTTLAAGVSPSDVTCQVAATVGFPGSFPYVIALDYGTSSEELVLVTAAAGTNLTITRAFDSTSASTHSSGAAVRHVWCGKDGNDSRAHEGSTSGVHGVVGNVVGDTDTQTLTNKSLTNPFISAGTLAGTFGGNPTFSGNLTLSGNLTVNGIGSERFKVKPTNEVRNNTASQANDTDLLLSLTTGTWIIDGYIEWNSTAAADIAIGFNYTGTGGSTSFWTPNGLSGGFAVDIGSVRRSSVAFSTAGQLLDTGGTTNTVAQPLGLLVATSNGTLNFRWAQGAATAVNTTVFSGSWIRAKRVA